MAVGGVACPDITSSNEILPPPTFVDEESVKKDWGCPVCHGVLRQPVQTECGHRLCETCWHKLLEQSECPPCPAGEDDCVLLTRGAGKVSPDYAGRKCLGKKQVFCLYHSFGCEYQMASTDWKQHVSNCGHAVVLCTYHKYGCEERVQRRHFHSHDETCAFLPKNCRKCKTLVAKCKMQFHLQEECLVNTEVCPLGCGNTRYTRIEMICHVEKCAVETGGCRFSRFGCPYKGNKADVNKHEQDAMENHMNLVLRARTRLSDENSYLQKELMGQEETNKSIVNKVKDAIAENQRLQKRLDTVLKYMQAMEKVAKRDAETLANIEVNTATFATAEAAARIRREMQQLRQEQRDMEAQLDSLEDQLSLESGLGISIRH